MALSNDEPREYMVGDIREYPIEAGEICYEGAAIGENGSGYSRALNAADVFQGFAEEQVDNSTGAAGDKNVRVKTRGSVLLEIAALPITSNDRPAVYASDDGTFTLTSTSNSLIGYVSQWKETGLAHVEFDAALVRAALQA